MKLRLGHTIAFAVAMMGIVAFIGAPLVSYQHLPQHARWVSKRTETASAPGTRLPDPDPGDTDPAPALEDAQRGQTNQRCHDPDCPYLHFFRTSSSPPTSSPILVTGAAAWLACAVAWVGRVERNPGQLPLLSIAPATSPPLPSMS